MRDAVRATKDYKGILGMPISFDDKGDVATPSLFVYQVKGKGFELVKTVVEVAAVASLRPCRCSRSPACARTSAGCEAIRAFDITVDAGEIVGLIGPNGSGKTTIFNLITGLLPRQRRPSAVLDGRHDLLGLPPHAITALGVARTFQNQRLFNQMTVLENVLVGRHCRSQRGPGRRSSSACPPPAPRRHG